MTTPRTVDTRTEPRHLVPLLALEGATLLSALGNGVAMVALPWLVLELTGSAAAAGAVAGVTALPLLLVSLFSGTLIDRIGRRRASVVSDLFSAVSVAAIPLVAWLGDLTFGWVLALAVLGALFDPAGITARETMLPGVARAGHLDLPRVNGIHEAVWGVAYLIGPGLGGLLIALIGAVGSLWVMVIGFLASALLMAAVHVPGAGRPAAEDRPPIWAGTWEGIRFVWRDPVLRAVTAISAAFVAVAYPVLGVVLPVIYQRLGEPGRLGLLLMAFSAGSVVGALSYGAVGHRISHRKAYLLALFGAAGAVTLFAVAPPFGWQLVGAALSGTLIGPLNPVYNLALQHRTPESMRGRAMGIAVALSYAAAPIGYLGVGALIELFDVTTALTVSALTATALLAVAWRSRALHGLDHGPQPVASQ